MNALQSLDEKTRQILELLKIDKSQNPDAYNQGEDKKGGISESMADSAKTIKEATDSLKTSADSLKEASERIKETKLDRLESNPINTDDLQKSLQQYGVKDELAKPSASDDSKAGTLVLSRVKGAEGMKEALAAYNSEPSPVEKQEANIKESVEASIQPEPSPVEKPIIDNQITIFADPNKNEAGVLDSYMLGREEALAADNSWKKDVNKQEDDPLKSLDENVSDIRNAMVDKDWKEDVKKSGEETNANVESDEEKEKKEGLLDKIENFNENSGNFGYFAPNFLKTGVKMGKGALKGARGIVKGAKNLAGKFSKAKKTANMAKTAANVGKMAPMTGAAGGASALATGGAIAAAIAATTAAGYNLYKGWNADKINNEEREKQQNKSLDDVKAGLKGTELAKNNENAIDMAGITSEMAALNREMMNAEGKLADAKTKSDQDWGGGIATFLKSTMGLGDVGKAEEEKQALLKKQQAYAESKGYESWDMLQKAVAAGNIRDGEREARLEGREYVKEDPKATVKENAKVSNPKTNETNPKNESLNGHPSFAQSLMHSNATASNGYEAMAVAGGNGGGYSVNNGSNYSEIISILKSIDEGVRGNKVVSNSNNSYTLTGM